MTAPCATELAEGTMGTLCSAGTRIGNKRMSGLHCADLGADEARCSTMKFTENRLRIEFDNSGLALRPEHPLLRAVSDLVDAKPLGIDPETRAWQGHPAAAAAGVNNGSPLSPGARPSCAPRPAHRARGDGRRPIEPCSKGPIQWVLRWISPAMARSICRSD